MFSVTSLRRTKTLVNLSSFWTALSNNTCRNRLRFPSGIYRNICFIAPWESRAVITGCASGSTYAAERCSLNDYLAHCCSPGSTTLEKYKSGAAR
jgi:hypothetical protein